MPNKNYIKGRAFEYRCMEHFRKLGYYCIRAYASKGLFDFIAVPPNTMSTLDFNDTLLVQAKTNGYVKPAERKELVLAAHRYKGTVLLAWIGKDHKIQFKIIKDDW